MEKIRVSSTDANEVLSGPISRATELQITGVYSPPITSGSPPSPPPPEPQAAGNAKMSSRDLADKYKVNHAALRGRLDRWRCEHDAGYSEVSNPKRNEPKYLYDESAVTPIIDALKAKPKTHKRATNVQRKKI